MKKVLITGGSGDLGKSIAYKIASELKEDCSIILHYNSNEEKVKKIAIDVLCY